jgi:DNA polymerase-1
MVPYAAGDTRWTLELLPLLGGFLDAAGERLYKTERALIPILADMEYRGARIDRRFLEAAAIDYAERQRLASEAVFAAAGRSDFDLDSNPQLIRVFQSAGVPLPAGPSGRATLTKDTLKALAGRHPLARAVSDYRKVAKIKSTYIDSLLAKLDEEDHVHCTFRAHGTRTGRLSSDGPNLQNVVGAMRAAFVPPEGHVIVMADYSMIELRVVAHFSQDPVLLAAFRGGEDVHVRTAIEVLGHSDDADEMVRRRKVGKNLNFAICYGAGPALVASMSGTSVDVARAHLEKFDRVYSTLARWKRQVVEEARRTGLVRNLYGRTRWLPILQDRDMRRTPACCRAERAAVNTIIQGTAADLFKESMVNVAGLLRERGVRTRMVLNVHDEIVFYVPVDELGLVPELKRVMEQPSIVGSLSVPLVVDISWSEANWRDKRKGIPTASLIGSPIAPAPLAPLEAELLDPDDEDAQDDDDARGAA